MEKYHFLDRTDDTKIYSQNNIGDYVLICEKQNQKFAKTIDDLTYGRIVRILTKNDHPRGIKVEIYTPAGEYRIGRIVYKIKDGKIKRK